MGNNNSARESGMKQQQEGAHMFPLPEGCITHVIAFTSPRDACASALVSKVFNVAANSDLVWEIFLPRGYNDILSGSVPPLKLPKFSSKKELFVYLCSNSLLLDGGTKSLSLEKMTGKKCVTLGAKTFEITWCGTPQYWKWRAHYGSRFAEVAELIDVCQLELNGRIPSQLLSTHTTYGVYLVVNGDEEYHVEEPPLDVLATFVGEVSRTRFRSDYLEHSYGRRYRRHSPLPNPTLKVNTSPSEEGDGWMEIEIGEFYNDEGEDEELQIFLRKNGAWKRSLMVEGIQFRPKANV